MIIAASRGYMDIVELLVTLGEADPSIRSKVSISAFFIQHRNSFVYFRMV
jgi:hypothetical protein